MVLPVRRSLVRLRRKVALAINPVIYAEVSIRFERIEDLEQVLSPTYFRRDRFPGSRFPCGKCFLTHRKKGGRKRSPLPDFFIGAHASVAGIPLLTRDISRYRRIFQIRIDCPGISLGRPIGPVPPTRAKPQVQILHSGLTSAQPAKKNQCLF